MKDKENLPFQTFPWGLITGIVITWGAILGYTYISVKAILRAFLLTYGSFMLPMIIPYILLLLLLAFILIFIHIKRQLTKNRKSSLLWVFLCLFLLISTCFFNMIVLNMPPPADFDPELTTTAKLYHKFFTENTYSILITLFFMIPAGIILNRIILKRKYEKYDITIPLHLYFISLLLCIAGIAISFFFNIAFTWIPFVIIPNLIIVHATRKNIILKTQNEV
ncbi:MAG: hypothetical protein U9O87_01560 [Verrucomicrobiota bacterium]|nr:hypothetical protein [Verrucomicrobiota bacterium]